MIIPMKEYLDKAKDFVKANKLYVIGAAVAVVALLVLFG